MSAGCKLIDYDVIGFDFDNTLVTYNLLELYKLQYKCMVKFLTERKGYTGLPIVMDENDIDFNRKGLFIDTKRGNIINLSFNGKILSASHGTKKLSEKDIIDIYGKDMRCSEIDYFINNIDSLYKLVTFTPCTDSLHVFFDFVTTMPTLLYAKIIDLLDSNGVNDYSGVINNILEAQFSCFSAEFPTIVHNAEKYIYKFQEIVTWLKKLGENSKLFLLTSGMPSHFNLISKHCFDTDITKLFHTAIFDAEKPYFFTNTNSFQDLNCEKITLKTTKGKYVKGSWQEYYKLLRKESGKDLRCLFIGDSVIDDIYGASNALEHKLDAVSIMEDSQVEGFFPGTHPSGDTIKSKFWGSYFELNGVETYLASVIKKNATVCVPSLEYLATKPMDYSHCKFWE